MRVIGFWEPRRYKYEIGRNISHQKLDLSSSNPGAILCLDFKLLGFYIKQVMSNTYNTVFFRKGGGEGGRSIWEHPV